jgi:hypothetical protein
MLHFPIEDRQNPAFAGLFPGPPGEVGLMVGFRVFASVTTLAEFFTIVGRGVIEDPLLCGVSALFVIIGKRKKPPTRTAIIIMTAMIPMMVFFPGLKPVPRGGVGGTGGFSGGGRD